MKLEQILKDSNYKLSLFSQAEIDLLEAKITTRETRGKETAFIICLIRNKEIQLKPEEIVRQLYLRRLLQDYNYPNDRIAVEFPVKFGVETKKADIVIRDKDHPDTVFIFISPFTYN
jgi:type I restriction enzyme M protein